MSDFASTSRSELTERRRQLRRQRRWRGVQAVWRTGVVMAIAGGLVWVTTLPAWVISKPDQVLIQGNQLLSTQAVQSILPIAYPQSLLALQPQAIAQQLESQAPIAEATVTRHLLPPGLTVQIRERHPVAIAYPSSTSPSAFPNQPTQSSSSLVGLLDEKGTWVPLQSYTALNQSLELPTLKVIGMRDQYRSQWERLYRAVSRSPVKISEIDWRDPANLILTTELGIVHFGSYNPGDTRFADQLRALDQMRHLPEKVELSQIAYIDLKNPDAPLIQMSQTQESVESDSP